MWPRLHANLRYPIIISFFKFSSLQSWQLSSWESQQILHWGHSLLMSPSSLFQSSTATFILPKNMSFVQYIFMCKFHACPRSILINHFRFLFLLNRNLPNCVTVVVNSCPCSSSPDSEMQAMRLLFHNRHIPFSLTVWRTGTIVKLRSEEFFFTLN